MTRKRSFDVHLSIGGNAVGLYGTLTNTGCRWSEGRGRLHNSCIHMHRRLKLQLERPGAAQRLCL